MAIACRTCGNQNPDGSAVCQYCGGSLQTTPGYDQPTQVADIRPQQQQSSSQGGGYGQQQGGGQYPVQQQYPQYPQYPPQRPLAPAPKDPQVGFLLELIGLLGFQGIGWIWAGETVIGVVLLFGLWIFLTIEVLLMFVLIGFCLLPLNLVIPIASGFLLQKRLKERQMLPAAHQPY